MKSLKQFIIASKQLNGVEGSLFENYLSCALIKSNQRNIKDDLAPPLKWQWFLMLHMSY